MTKFFIKNNLTALYHFFHLILKKKKRINIINCKCFYTKTDFFSSLLFYYQLLKHKFILSCISPIIFFW